MRKSTTSKEQELANKQTQDNLEQVFSQFDSVKDKNETVEVLKELFDKNKLDMITELTRDEISILTRIQVLAEYKNIPMFKKISDVFETLMISKGRKSRKELITAISKSEHKDKMQDKMRNFFER